MVNINLNKEDETREQQSFKDETFAETLNLESGDFAEDRQDFRSDISEFTQSSSNARIYIVIAALLIVVSLIIWMLLPSGDATDEQLPDITDPGAIETVDPNLDQIPVDDAAGDLIEEPARTPVDNVTDAAPQGDTFDRASISSLSAAEQRMMISAALSGLAVSSVTDALSGDAVVSLVRYTEQSYLSEIIARSEASLQTTIDNIRQSTGSSDFRVISTERDNIQGRSVMKALVSGSLSADSSPLSITGDVAASSLSEFTAWIRNTAQSAQLSVETLKSSDFSSQDQGYTVTPVNIILKGSMSSASGFLETMVNTSPNVVVEKVSLINNDASASSNSSVSLVLLLSHYAF